MDKICKEMRKNILTMIYNAKSGHPGGSLSIVEILAVLYGEIMAVDASKPLDPLRDRFILSKGHAAPALYAVLAQYGYFSKEELKTFRKTGSKLQGHPDMKKLSGVDYSTGSLGQGVSIATGMALGAKHNQTESKIYTLLGDGELQEGLVWESAMAAAHYKLDNLTVIIDHNGLQIDGTNDEVMSLLNIGEKYKSFGFEVIEIDGNNVDQIRGAFAKKVQGKPKCVLAHTVKGKGVSFMENQVSFHGRAPNEAEYTQAMKELEEV